MSLASIDQFITNGLAYNGARPSRFLASVTVPTGVTVPATASSTSLNKFQFSCKAASVPQMTIGQVDIGYMGRKIKYSGDRTWDDWEVTVLLDNDYVTRDMFESWMDSVNAVEDNVMDSAIEYTGYKSAGDILHLGQVNDTPIGHYNLVGLWPSYIGPIQLSWDQQNQISEFNVRFAFDNCVKSSANPISGFSIGTKGAGNTNIQAVVFQ